MFFLKSSIPGTPWYVKGLTSKGSRIHGFIMTNSFNHIVKNIIQMGPNFISPESMKNIACVGQKQINLNKRKST